MGLSLESHGNFDKTIHALEFMRAGKMFRMLDSYGRKGVDLLASATPRRTGLASESWGYLTSHKNGQYRITWFNTDREGKHRQVNVAVILQYGHGTGTGGYVEGIDYINPAMRPLFDALVEDVWKEVRNA